MKKINNSELDGMSFASFWQSRAVWRMHIIPTSNGCLRVNKDWSKKSGGRLCFAIYDKILLIVKSFVSKLNQNDLSFDNHLKYAAAYMLDQAPLGISL